MDPNELPLVNEGDEIPQEVALEFERSHGNNCDVGEPHE